MTIERIMREHERDERDLELYLDWVNNFLTVTRFAEYYGMSVQAATNLINRERAKQ